ncbi:hypothetical protein [Rhizobium leucaenae]|uniref:hypothetical protein n=1 Tax=Rhizobium leucaenae TaxID=29450 RepID=UPI000B330E6F|nr:hypothetical protein [Rhizobium leucaenae]
MSKGQLTALNSPIARRPYQEGCGNVRARSQIAINAYREHHRPHSEAVRKFPCMFRLATLRQANYQFVDLLDYGFSFRSNKRQLVGESRANLFFERVKIRPLKLNQNMIEMKSERPDWPLTLGNGTEVSVTIFRPCLVNPIEPPISGIGSGSNSLGERVDRCSEHDNTLGVVLLRLTNLVLLRTNLRFEEDDSVQGGANRAPASQRANPFAKTLFASWSAKSLSAQKHSQEEHCQKGDSGSPSPSVPNILHAPRPSLVTSDTIEASGKMQGELA